MNCGLLDKHLGKFGSEFRLLENKVFITGNTGFKGSWLSLILLKLNCIIVGYSFNPPTKPSLFNEAALNKKFTTYFQMFEILKSCMNVLIQLNLI